MRIVDGGATCPHGRIERECLLKDGRKLVPRAYDVSEVEKNEIQAAPKTSGRKPTVREQVQAFIKETYQG